MTKQQGGSVGGQWAQQQQEGLKRPARQATENEARKVVDGGHADQRSQQENVEAATDQALKSQQEGPAAYAPQQDEPTDDPEAQSQQDQLAKMKKAERESVRTTDQDPAKKKNG